MLFFNFAGMTAIALGLALMMGIRLEENFNRPWCAKDLLDFWSRWHMSLTNWCRDYVYRPVMALTRSALAGLVAAMLAIGLWHEISFYYVLWSFWQTLGVVLSRTIMPRIASPLPAPLRRVLAPLAILAWLALARPVIGLLL
jgi:alginate O-acetyltransferase complex protein AlgI